MGTTDVAVTATENQTNSHGPGRYRIYDSLWLLLLLMGAFALVNRSAVARDPDLWWHLRSGDWITQHHSVPWRDPFGRYTLGQSWLDYTWLFDWGLSSLYKWGGLIAIFALTRALVAACVLALFDVVSQYVSQGYALILGSVYLVTLFQLETPRPWLLSILFLTMELRLLLEVQEKNRVWLLLWVIPLFAVWANLHIVFVYGLGMLGLFGLVGLLPKRFLTTAERSLNPGQWWLGFALATGATLVNPYGWRIYQVVYSYAFDRPGASAIQEMRPFSFEVISDWAVIGLLMLAIGAMGWSRKFPASSCLLLLAGCWFGFHAGRDIWFLAILSAVVAARAFRENAFPNPLKSRQILPVVLITLCLYVAEIHWGVVSEAELEQASKETFPVDASAFIAEHALPEPLFNTFYWGGYLLWRLPTMLVSIDGRANLYGNKAIVSFLETANGTQNWSSDPKLQNAKTILLPPGLPLASILRLDPSFKIAYEDKVALVFLRIQ